LKKNRVKELWREGKAAVGTWVVLGSPITAEIIANMGYDWVVVDTEHGSIDINTTQSIVQAVLYTGAVPMVRVPWNVHQARSGCRCLRTGHSHGEQS